MFANNLYFPLLNRNIMKNLKIYIFLLTIVLIAIARLFTATYEPVAATSGVHIIMGTTVSVTSIADNQSIAEKAAAEAVKAIKRIDAKMSYYNPQSQLSLLNNKGFIEAVEVDKELFCLIQRAIEFNEITEGAFDCTVAPVLELWRKASADNFIPTEEQLTDAKSRTGSDKLILDADNSTIRFTVEGVRIDLGGIAKGFAIDKAIDAMRNAGAIGGLVDAGGDIRCFGKAKNGDKWVIGLQNPDIENPVSPKMLMRLELADSAITTSGDYYRFVVVGGEKQSHILNPSEGKPSRGLSSVSIIAADATTADALSTAVTVLGADKGINLVESIENVETLIITEPDKQIIKSSGLTEYILQ